MNSKELWQKLEKMETNDVLILIIMCCRYAIMKRNYELKNLLKEIKKTINFLDEQDIKWNY